MELTCTITLLTALFAACRWASCLTWASPVQSTAAMLRDIKSKQFESTVITTPKTK